MSRVAVDLPGEAPLGAHSALLRGAFEGHPLALETLDFITGDRLGAGLSREVYRYALDDKWVIKFEPQAGRFQNVLEREIWTHVQYHKLARWFAPCGPISDCGRILLQRYCEPLPATGLPDKVPSFFTDLKPGNWGRLAGKPVALDYALTLLIEKGMTSRLKVADWT